MHILFDDQFLIIDGQMITFLEYRGPMQFSYHKDYITMPNGAPGFVYTTEFRQKFLGKNFYISRVDIAVRNDNEKHIWIADGGL